MARILKTALLLSCMVLAEGAFVSRPLMLSEQKASCSTFELNAQRLDRRQALGWAATAAAFVTLPTAAARAEGDAQAALDAFGKELAGGWPHSPSPLPTAVKSAAELTAPPGKKGTDAREGMNAMSDLESALKESAKAKQVDPRTHG